MDLYINYARNGDLENQYFPVYTESVDQTTPDHSPVVLLSYAEDGTATASVNIGDPTAVVNSNTVTLQNADVRNPQQPETCPIPNVFTSGRILDDVGTISTYDHFISAEMTYKCNQCCYLCQDYDLMVAHINKAHVDSNGLNETVLVCGVCRKSGFTLKKALKEHMTKEHSLIEGSQNESQHDNDTLRKAMLQFQSDVRERNKTSRKMRCIHRECEAHIYKMEHLSHHNRCHTNGGNGFSCYECDKMFGNWKNCLSHLWSKHRIDAGMYTCPICKNFKGRSPVNVLSHMEIHGGLLPYLCTVCGKRFRQKGNLVAHNFACVRKKGDLPDLSKGSKGRRILQTTQCDVCKMEVTSKHDLQAHMKSHADHKKQLPTVLISN